MQVAGQVTPQYSLVRSADDNDYISFSRSVLQRFDLQIAVLAPICRVSDTSHAYYEIAPKPPACLLYASCNANLTARSSFTKLLAAMSLPTQYSLIPREKRRSSIKT